MSTVVGSRGRASTTAWLPGLAAASAVALAARGITSLLPATVGEVVVAIALGLVLAAAIGSRPVLAPGLSLAVRRLLRIGIVLLGARLSLDAVAAVGASVVLLVAVLIVVTLALGVAAGRLAGLPLPLTLLLAVGTAICGNSAILATAPLLGAEHRHVSVAVATITIFGLLAVLLYPLLGRAVGMDEVTFGRWAGLAVNDTSQVVATGLAYGSAAGDTAVVVKLVRNAAMAPVLFALAWAWPRLAPATTESSAGSARPVGSTGSAGRAPATPRYRDAVPLFVLGFLLVAAVNSAGLLDPVVAGRSLAVWAAEIAAALILVAVAAIGLGTPPDVLARSGRRPILVGLALSAVVSLTALTLILATGAVAR